MRPALFERRCFGRDSASRCHPEGYIEAFAVLYREFAEGCCMGADHTHALPATLPGIQAGVRGMRFIERAIASSRAKAGWIFRTVMIISGTISGESDEDDQGTRIFLAQFAGMRRRSIRWTAW